MTAQRERLANRRAADATRGFEMIRRLRLGDLQKVLRSRYGHELPDDDAGREDLRELLLPISLGNQPARRMHNAIEVWAPWMMADEARQLLDEINRSPPYQRKPTSCELGERLRLSNHERESLGLRTISPVDMTAKQLADRRRAKNRDRMWRQRRANGSKDREAWLANAKSRLKPWKAKGKSRATWYRERRQKPETKRETGPCAIRVLTTAHTPVSHRTPGESQRKRTTEKARKEAKEARDMKSMSLTRLRASRTHLSHGHEKRSKQNGTSCSRKTRGARRLARAQAAITAGDR
jgi:hypothetical protein